MWGDCDSAGIVYYPNFYKWFDQGTHELVRKAGYSVKEMRDRGRDILLVETGCKYRAPAYYDDIVELEAVVEQVRGKVFRLNHACRRGETTLCEGFEVRAYADISNPQSFRALPIPADMAASLAGE